MWPSNIYIAAKDIRSLRRIGGTIEECCGGAAIKITKPANYQKYNEQWLTDACLNINVEAWIAPTVLYSTTWRPFWESATGIPPGEKEVDHIYGRARGAAQGYAYVRLALLPRFYNRSWARWDGIRCKLETRASTDRPLLDLRPLDDLDVAKLEAELGWREYIKPW